MNYEGFLKGINSILTPLGLTIRDGVLVDDTGQYGSCYSIQGILSSLWFYFNAKGKKYTNFNDMLSDLLLLSDGSNAYYIKSLINWTSNSYRYHYKVRVDTTGSISFSTTGKGLTSFTFTGVEYPLAPTDELFLAVPNIAAGVYDLYIYSTTEENLTFETVNCTITYLEYEHCISYVFTSTDYGFVYATSKYGSVQKVDSEASVDIILVGDTIKMHSDRSGQYLIYIYCEDKDEELVVTEAASGCSLGSKTIRW